MKRLWNMRRAQPPQGPPMWVPVLGELQKTLQKGEYLPLRPLPMFESNFVQVTNHGGPVFVHHSANRLTMGVAASLPGLVLPDILLIAQPPQSRDCSGLTLTRMIPLDLAHLYVHDLPTWRIKLRLITGRYYYLELDAPDHELGFLFDCWIRLINLLHEPNMTWVPRTLKTPPLDLPLEVAPASTWQLQDQASSRHSVEVAKNIYPYNSRTAQKQRKAKVLKHKLKSQAVGDSLPLMCSQMGHPDVKKKPTKKFHPDACPERSNTQIHVSDKDSITIRTIFSIISKTVKENQSSPQACTSNSEGATGWGGLIQTPSHCISGDSPNFIFLNSYKHMDTFMWPQGFEDLMDPESSALSSSLHLSPYPPALYCSPPHSSFPRSKAKPMSSMKNRRPLPSKKVPITIRRGPFILDQSHKVRDVPALPRKAPAAPPSTQKAIPDLSWKASPLLPGPQKTPHIPDLSWKTPVLLAPPQKTLPPIQKFPHTSAIPQKEMLPPTPKKECLVPHTPSQKFLASSSQYQQVNDLPTSGAKAPIDPCMLLAEIPRGGVLGRNKTEGKQEPVMLVGLHETKVIDIRNQTRTLESPSTTTQKESKDILISKSMEVTLDNLRSTRKLEGRFYEKKEEVTVDHHDKKSKEVGQQKRWVTTKKMAIELPLPEGSRPFSVEGLTLAKLMITANSQEQHLKPPVVSLPSWLSMASRASTMSRMANMPFACSQMKPVVVREQPEFHMWVKNENTQQWTKRGPSWDPVGSSKVPLHSMPTSDSPKMANTPQVPIPLPAVPWEDLPQPHIPEPPVSKSKALAKVPQKPVKKRQVTMRVPNRGPVAMMGTSSEILLPIVLELEKLKNMATKVKTTPEPDVNYPPPSTQLPQHLK